MPRRPAVRWHGTGQYRPGQLAVVWLTGSCKLLRLRLWHRLRLRLWRQLRLRLRLLRLRLRVRLQVGTGSGTDGTDRPDRRRSSARGMETQQQLLLLLLLLLLQRPGCLTDQLSDCDVVKYGAKCDSMTDDTAALQAAIDACAPQRRRVVIGGGLCLTQPLTLRTHSQLVVTKGATLKAGQKWVGTPFLYAANATDIAIVGNGTIDGSGAQWWLPHGQPGRPHLIRFDDVSHVLLENVTLLNAANHFTNLHGAHYRIYGVTMRSPPSHIAPNTDGINTKCSDVHVRGCDISNGDDSVVMKAPSRDVLVEDTVVRQGNGFVVGTADDTFEHVFRNITFRRSLAENTMFGCHVKFKGSQSGLVDGVRFEDIVVRDPTHYAIGINTNGQSSTGLGAGLGSNVSIANVSFVRVSGSAPAAGRFTCNAENACRGIRLEHVHLDVPPGNDTTTTGCTFANAVGQGLDVSPASCVPPSGL